MKRRHKFLGGRRALIKVLGKAIALVALTLGLTVFAYLGMVTFPQLMFSNHITYQSYDVWSDRTIPPQIEQVLNDATRRLRTSDLHEPNQKVKLFFCNDSWRLLIHALDDQSAGNTDTWLTRNMYIRASDISNNRFYAPDNKPIPDEAHRPLSYVIAHEVAHVIEAIQFDRPLKLKYPNWLLEGYADYVAKGGDFDFDENRRLLKINSPLLDVQKSGLYRRFHLEVAYLIDKKGLTARQVFANPPQEVDLLTVLKSDAILANSSKITLTYISPSEEAKQLCKKKSDSATSSH